MNRIWKETQGMHEMSIAQSLLDMAEEEARANGCNRLISIRVQVGKLSGVMPDALAFCMEALTKGTPHEGVRLETVIMPLVLRCPFCNKTFRGEADDILWMPCPHCGEFFGHSVEGGRELVLARLEADVWQPQNG